MKIKIDSNEVEYHTKKIDDLSLELYNEIKGCITELESLKSNYNSTESTYVIQTCESYFDHLKVLPFTINELNDSTKKANKTYTEQDSNFLNDIQKKEIEEN